MGFEIIMIIVSITSIKMLREKRRLNETQIINYH
jgi:hypothetical protein